MTTFAPLLGDKLAWDGKRLIVTDPTLIESKLRRKALSASTSKSMQSCAARWVGERLLRSEEENPFDPAPLGTAAHAILEDLYGLDPQRRTLATARKLLLRAAEKMWPDVETEPDAVRAMVRINKRRWIEEVEAAYQGIFAIEDPTTIDVWGRELQIDGLTVEGVPTNGFIDRVRKGLNKRSGRTGLIPEDYKSGKVPSAYHLRHGDDHGDQLRVYAAALKEKTGEMPVGARVLYTKFGVVRDVDLRPAAMNKTLRTFRLSWSRHNKYMKTGEFPVKVSALCGWCPLVNSCPAAADEGKEAKVEGLPAAEQLGIPTVRPGITPAAVPAAVPAPVADTAPAGHQTDREEAPAAVAFAAFPEDEFFAADLADVMRAAAAAAHMNDSGENPEETEQNGLDMKEEKPWEPYAGGELNPASYSAIGAFGIVELAMEALHKAGQPITKTTVQGLARTFHHIIAKVQKEWTGSVSLQDGANTRLRGALRTVLGTLPIPFGKDGAAWDEWVDAATRRTRSIAKTATDLFADGPQAGRPWENLEKPGAETAEAPAAAAADEAADESTDASTDEEADTVESAAAEVRTITTPAKARPARRAPADYDFPSDDELADVA